MMDEEMSESDYVKSYDPNQYARPCLAADAVVFRYVAESLQVLLIQRKNHPFRGRWAFPGGFIEVYEDPDVAVRRELSEETGIEATELHPLGVFGRPDRDPRYHVVSTVYFEVTSAGDQTPQAADDAANAAWYPARKTPPLAFDHAEILDAALQRLRREIARPSFALRFFARGRATGSDLLSLYQAILGKKLDPGRFFRRLSKVCRKTPTL
jgi:8-oxo-dGTP diphosphatase